MDNSLSRPSRAWDCVVTPQSIMGKLAMMEDNDSV